MVVATVHESHGYAGAFANRTTDLIGQRKGHTDQIKA
jgi:hypothetical protein